MKLACAGETRAPPRASPFQPGTIDERAGGCGNVRRHVSAIGVLKNAAGARRLERLRLFAIRQRLAGDLTKSRRIAGQNPEHRRQQHFACSLQAASIVPEFHLFARKIARRARRDRRDAPTRQARR